MEYKSILKFIAMIAFIILSFTFSSSCAKESGDLHKLNIAVVNGGDIKGKLKPITISVFIDEKPVGKNQVIKNDRPFILGKTLKNGNHTIRITEGTTGAVFKRTVQMDKPYWLKVEFCRESKSMGYFESKIQETPWGYEFEKKGKKEENDVKSRRSYEEEIDRKLDSLVEKKKEKDEKKTNKAKKSKG